MTYRVTSPLHHDGTAYEVGAELSADAIEERHAEALIEMGVLEWASPADGTEADGAGDHGGQDGKGPQGRTQGPTGGNSGGSASDPDPEGGRGEGSGADPDPDPDLDACAELDAQDPERADRALFTGEGKPQIRALSKALDREIRAAERDAIWNRYLESRSAE